MSQQTLTECASCGEAVSGEDRFCSACGAAVSTPARPHVEAPVSPPPAPPPHYPPPAAPVQSTGTNGMAIASLVLGIVWIWGLGSLLALIFGVIGKNQIDASGGRQGGRGMAVAGIVLGSVGLAGLVVFIILITAASSSTTY